MRDLVITLMGTVTAQVGREVRSFEDRAVNLRDSDVLTLTMPLSINEPLQPGGSLRAGHAQDDGLGVILRVSYAS